jgi:type VI secretion system secreted protein VgrG
MHGSEELGKPFLYEITFFSEEGDLTPQDLLGQTVTVELDLPENPVLPNNGHRYFNGYVTRMGRLGRHRKYHTYTATVRPWIWLLSRARDCRIFQDKTVPEIIKAVFQKHGLTDFEESLTASYSVRNYVVQYRETDLDFVTRLMAQEGIYYFFKHEPAKHVLVLADSYSAHVQVKGYETVPFYASQDRSVTIGEHLDVWHSEQEIRSGTVVLNDFNFEMPRVDLLAKVSSPNEHDKSDLEIYDQPGKYLKSADGETCARLRFEEVNAQFDRRTGGGDVRGITAGGLFSLTPLWKYQGSSIVMGAASSLAGGVEQDQLADSEYREYLVTSANFDIQGPHYESQAGTNDGDLFRTTLTAIEGKCPYRMPRMPAPVVHGVQTATVVGEAGEEIWTDKYGRVKVQFHWDREGKRNENSSCWVRVAQVWAGNQWGAMHIPRIGQEVIVGFLEGDPDKPIITGRVYNADNMPPYELPANKTQSGIKSRSSKGGTASNFNEIRFEDLKGKEEVHIQAERDESTLVKRNQSTSVGADRSVSVGGNHSVSVTGTQSTTVTKDETQTFKAKRKMTVTGTNDDEVTGKHTATYHAGRKETVTEGDTLEAGPTKKVTVKGLYDIDVQTEYKLVQGTNSVNMKGSAITVNNGKCEIHLEGPDATVMAKSSLTLKCGDASITLKDDGSIEINGSQKVNLSGGGSTVGLEKAGATMKGMKVGVTGEAITEITGALIKIN